MNEYPKVIDPDLVGEYPAMAKAGGGYFFDEVLEYRVWFCVADGSPDTADGDDYYYAFGSHEEALDFSRAHDGAGEPLALIRQREWVNEPKPGHFVHVKGERIAEWKTEWLSRGARQPGAIESFIAARSADQKHWRSTDLCRP